MSEPEVWTRKSLEDTFYSIYDDIKDRQNPTYLKNLRDSFFNITGTRECIIHTIPYSYYIRAYRIDVYKGGKLLMTWAEGLPVEDLECCI